MNRKAGLAIVASLLLAGLTLVACGPKTASISADLTDFQFTPKSWEVPAGSEVTLTLTNNGTVEHEWVLFEKGYEVSMPFDDNDEGHIYWEGEVEAGESETFTFTAPSDPGTYQIVCGIPGHIESGMTGTLTVR